MGPGIPGSARPRHQVLLRGGRREGRSGLAGQQGDLRHRPAHGDDGVDGRPVLGDHQGRADRRDRVLELGRLLRRRAQVRRLGHDHPRGPVRQAGVPAHRGRPRKSRGRVGPLGQDDLGDRAPAEAEVPRPAASRIVDRSRGRGAGVVCRRGQRPASRRRPLGRWRRDGLEEPEGDRGTRHAGCGQRARSEGDSCRQRRRPRRCLRRMR